MAIPKWNPFGAQPQPQQQTPAPDRDTAARKPDSEPIITSADAKRFGLENFGNTCYANSVIQALYFCAPFRELLLKSPDSSAGSMFSPIPLTSQSEHVRRNPERMISASGGVGTESQSSTPHSSNPSIPLSPPSLFSALRSLFIYISQNASDKGTVAPRAFIDKLKELNELFRSTQHQDAHEFLMYLLNKVVEEIEEENTAQQNGTGADDLSNSITTLASRVPPSTIATTTTTGKPLHDSTFVHRIFEGVLTSETRCLTCETVSSRDESFLDLSIDIEQNSSVSACLRQFSASEMLCQKNKFFCDSCCDLQEAEKRMKIKTLPNVLALHLKRFKYQEDVQKYIKLAYRVAFPMELRLFNTVDDTDDADRLFELFGIVVHIGSGPHHGHYISIIKAMGTWFVFDDENVNPISESEIPKYFGDSNSGSAYVLYYQAVNMDLPDLGVPVSQPEPTQHVSTPGPAHPPGLTEEGDSSDISDPPFPITPSPSSPMLSFEKVEHPSSLTLDVANLGEPATPVTSSPVTKTSTVGGIFRRPSAAVSKQNAPTVRPADGTNNLPKLQVPSTPVNSSHLESAATPKKSPSKKTSTWFKRKSKVDSRPVSQIPSTPSSLVGQEPRAGPSGSSPHETGQYAVVPDTTTSYPSDHTKPNGLTVKTKAHDRVDGSDTSSPSSRPSSIASISASSRVESLHRKARTELRPLPSTPHGPIPSSRLHDSKRESVSNRGFSLSTSLPPRPSTSGAAESPRKATRDLPPLPPLPAIPGKHSRPKSSGNYTGLSSSRDEPSLSSNKASSPSHALPLTSFPHSMTSSQTSSTGMSTDENHSPITTSNASSNFKKARRKLSLTAPLLGFRKKDKHKDSDKDSGPPSSYTPLSGS